MHFPVMGLDRAEGPCTEAAVLEITPVGWLLAVSIQVLPQVNQVLAAVVTTVTFEGPVFAVAKTHVVSEGGWQRTSHITQGHL